jgi:hypothetical protein
MENTITLEGFAFTDGETKLFPLCARNSDGSVNKYQTCMLIMEAGRTFGQQSAPIPGERIADVLSQIHGAAISHGFVLRVDA